jgi:hypothetical protein
MAQFARCGRVLGIDPGAGGANAALDEEGDLLGVLDPAQAGAPLVAVWPARLGRRPGSCPRDSKLDQIWIPGEPRRTTVSK